MRRLKFILMVSVVLAFGFGCSKDKDKVSELELNGIEVGEPRENLLTLGVTYCIEIRRM